MKNKIIFFVFVLLTTNFVLGAKIQDEIYQKFENGEEKVSVIIIEKENSGLKTRDIGGDEEKIYSKIIGVEELEELRKNGNILGIEYNRPLRIFLQNSTKIILANSSWNLKANQINLTGKNRAVCILDTGINASHPDFAGRILAEKCYCSVSDSGLGGCCPDGTDDEDSADDDNGHGTPIAGIVGAAGGIKGIAPEVGLVVVKIMNASGSGSALDLINGIQWCVDNSEEYNISVISASLGDSSTKRTTYCDEESSTTTSKINSAIAKNISVVFASGNDGWDDGISWPACITNATPVSATTKLDVIASYANRNSLVKLFAPGSTINSTKYLGGYETRDGTSMATPMVAGAVAILGELLNLTNQMMTPQEIEDVLYETGKPLIEGSNNYARINIYDAVLLLDNISPNVTLIIPANEEISPDVNWTFVCNATDWQLANLTFYIWNSTELYYNETKDLTGEYNSTEFNVSNIYLGEYNWTCEATDDAGNNFSASNFSFIVGGILTELVFPENDSYKNLNETNFSCRSLSEESYDLSNVTFYIWNSTGDLIYNLTNSTSGFDNITNFSYVFSMEGNYSWNCKSVNNATNASFGDGNFTFTFDNSPPVISDLTESSITTSSVVISWTTNELANSSASYGTNNSDYVLSHSISFSGLSSSTTYSYTVWSCDKANNCENESGSFTTGVSSLGSNSGSSSTNSGSPSSATENPKKYSPTKEELNKGYEKSFGKNDRVEFKLNDENHSILIFGVDENKVELTIKSEPINLTLKVGDEKKLNLSSGELFDLYLKLNSVNKTKANLTIKSISEKIFIEEKNNSVEENSDDEDKKKNEFEWIFVVLVLAIIFGVILFSRKKNKNGEKVAETKNRKRENSGKKNGKRKTI